MRSLAVLQSVHSFGVFTFATLWWEKTTKKY